jgi:hypothetical protein
MRRSTIGAQTTRIFAGIALVLASCGDDGAGGDGDLSEAEDEASSENCGKGEYPTDGEITLCKEAGDGCVAIEAARGYTSFYGNVSIRGVSDLEPLHCLQKAGGFSISNATELEDLTGLESLEELGTLSLVDDPALKSLAGLDGLKNLEYLSLVATGLESVPGLPSGLIVNNLSIEYHEELTSLAGLEGIEVTDMLFISDNPMLPQCEALAYAASLTGVEATVENNDLAATCD